MPSEISYRNLTIPRNMLEFYRDFDYTECFNTATLGTANYCFNLADYPTTFRLEITKKKIKTLDIE